MFLFQASIIHGRVNLAQLKKADIVAIFQPITKLSVLCKLCKHIIHCTAIHHLNKYNILSDVQHGYMQHQTHASSL